MKCRVVSTICNQKIALRPATTNKRTTRPVSSLIPEPDSKKTPAIVEPYLFVNRMRSNKIRNKISSDSDSSDHGQEQSNTNDNSSLPRQTSSITLRKIIPSKNRSQLCDSQSQTRNIQSQPMSSRDCELQRSHSEASGYETDHELVPINRKGRQMSQVEFSDSLIPLETLYKMASKGEFPKRKFFIGKLSLNYK